MQNVGFLMTRIMQFFPGANVLGCRSVMLALLYNNTSVYTNILSCRRGRVEDEIPTYKTEYLYIPSICTINDLFHDQ